MFALMSPYLSLAPLVLSAASAIVSQRLIVPASSSHRQGWTDRSANRTLSTRTQVKGRDPRSEPEVEASALCYLGQMLFARTDPTVHTSSGD
jgi:hypothetical protein